MGEATAALESHMVIKKKVKKASKPVEDAAAEHPAAPEALELGDGAGEDELTISDKFSKKYNERKDKEELAKNRKLLEEEGSDSSNDEEEDDAGDMLTSKMEHKIFDTLAKIRSRDPTIYDRGHHFFGEEDFEEGGAQASSSAKEGSKKSVKYKDFLRDTLLKDGADAIANEEEALEKKAAAQRRGKTPRDEQQELKAQMIAAAHADSAEEEEDDLFTVKAKTTGDMAKEEEDFEKFLKKGGGKPIDADGDEIMARYWKADEDLDEGEQFLRDFVLNKGWLDTGDLQASGSTARPGGYHLEKEDLQQDDLDDSADEDLLEKQDDFERDYNFRFEMEEGKQVQGHARFPEGSVRETGDKRKRQRAVKAERQDADKIRRTEELKRLKNLKKLEIQRRLKQLQEVTGNHESALGAIDLDEAFDPDSHDKAMDKFLGEGYDEQEEELDEEELTKAPRGLEKDLDVADGAAALDEVVDAEDVEEEVADDQWWRCDDCGRGIPAGKRRFDCTVCDDFTLCSKCFRVRRHPHKFARKRVPEKCQPPAFTEADESAAQEEGAPEDQTLDDYFQLDYEDIIGGDLPTRFKYKKVDSNDYGLTGHDILNMSDAELNRLMPLKKLRPYRSDGSVSAGRGGGGGRGGGRGGGSKGGGRGGDSGADGKGKGKDKGKSKGGGKGGKGKTGLSSQRLAAYDLGEKKEKRKRTNSGDE